MIAFEVNDMTCGHCASTITKALAAVDKQARVQIDLGKHRVQIESDAADAAEFAEAIRDAGYDPQPAPQDTAPASAPPENARAAGGCCGCR